MNQNYYFNINQISELNRIGSITSKSFPDLIIDRMDMLVFICSPEDYKILYMNALARQLYGDGIGHVCWKWFRQNADTPCPSCKMEYLADKSDSEEEYIFDQYNQINGKWYEVRDRLIDWSDGKKVKLHIAYNIDHRKQDEEKQMVQHKQQELFAKIAISFNKEEPFSTKVLEVLELVGNFAGVDRISIFENYSGKQNSSLTYEWCKEGIQPKINFLRELVLDSNIVSFKLILKEKLFSIIDLNDPKFRDLFASFRRFRVRSMLFMPLFLHESHIGFLSFEVCDKLRIWNEDEIQLLETFGNIISTSLERKNIEEKRLRVEMSLREANATKDRFFSIITRDLLAPFSSLISLSSMLLENYAKWPEEKRLLFVNSIMESSKQEYRLLENLIIWSKIQLGTIEFFPKDVDIRSAINLAAEQLLENAIKKNISISGIPQDFIFVYADYHMLHNIFKNLLSNAIKFTPENGEIRIDVKSGPEFIEVGVFDNGIGIEKAYINTLFNIDRISDELGPMEERGTGLGLIICREFVEKNGGKIWVDSKLGVGSCFKFTIPISK